MNVSTERFDGAAIWQTLSQEEKDAIGAAALELVSAHFCMEEASNGGPFQTPESRAADASVEAADAALHLAFCEAVLQSELTDGEDRLKFPSVIGAICRTCGCSQNDACFPPCGWAEADLCSGCKEKAGAA